MAGNTEEKQSEYIEDIPDKPISIEDSLPDKELIKGGMRPVKVWVRTNSSKNAERKRKQREEDEKGKDGKRPIKQLNLQSPIDDASRDALKLVNKQLVDGDLSPSDLDVIGRLDVMRTGAATNRILEAGGWRAAIMRRLLGSGY